MRRAPFWPVVLLGWALPPSLAAAAPSETARATRPNVLLFVADDMTWHDCEPYGSPDVRTPNLARLAAEGLTFDACFTATAMCSPSRQQLYTGLYPVRNGAYPNSSRVHDGTRSLVHHLSALGYRVGLIGKRHIGPTDSFPFESVGRKRDGASDTDAIAEFVGRDASEPYCLVVASDEPHTPWDRGPQEAYDPEALEVPPYLGDTPATRRELARYFAEITFLDAQVGACMDVVDASAGADDTLFLFTSEHGSSFPFGGKWTCYETGLRTALIARWPGRVRPGTRTDAIVQYVDVVPTLIAAAGGDPGAVDTGCPAVSGERGFDGRSFLDVLAGAAANHGEHAFGVHTTRGVIGGARDSYPIRSVRSRRFQYIRNLQAETPFTVLGTGDLLDDWRAAGGAAAARAAAFANRPAEELYDLDADPWELTNLAEDPAFATQKAELRAELERWMEQQGDRGIETEALARRRQGQGEPRQRKKKT